MPDNNGNITPDDMWDLEVGNEANRPTAYDDGRGNITVGVGHALDLNARSDITDLPGNPNFDDVHDGRQSLTDEQIQSLFDLDMGRSIENARAAVGPNAWDALPATAQMAAADIAFNAGGRGLTRSAGEFVADLRDDNLEAAADALALSPWANQAVPSRAQTDVILTNPQAFINEVVHDVHDILGPLLENPPDWSVPLNTSQPGDWEVSDDVVGQVASADPTAAGDDDTGGNVGYQESPSWDGGQLGDPAAPPGYSGDGYSGGGEDEEATGDPGAYGAGGSYGGGQAGGNTESGGQFGEGDGGYEGEGGFGGYDDGGDEGGNDGE